ncbi:hypothetical protein WA158_006774 [Blastocystis sp. Blastoise]
MSEEVAREGGRIMKGTEQSMKTSGHLCENFVPMRDAPFLKTRSDLFTELYTKFRQTIEAKPHDAITVTLPDGTTKEALSWKTTPLDIANSISKGLAQHVVAAKVVYTDKVEDKSIVAAEEEEEKEETGCCCGEEQDEGKLWDLTRELEGNCKVTLLKFEDLGGKQVFWHSSAHILGEALEHCYGVKLCIGPALQDGFYYDAYMGSKAVGDVECKEIEAEAQKIVHNKQPFERLVCTKEEALQLFEDNPFKLSIIRSKVPDGAYTTVYRCGDLCDLCMGPHLPDTGMVKGFAVSKNSACYWLGSADNDTLQRIYGISFPNTKELKEWVKFQEEAKKNDHRRLGETQELFFFHELSPGSCFFEPLGAHVYNTLIEFIRKQYHKRGYTEVITPNVYNFDLWKISGHADHYRDDMFLFNCDDTEYGLKPMNCPGHCLMFKHRSRSYRDLPLRLADFGVLHRNELSGALNGLTRVRRFQQDDCHIFCREDQIKQEVASTLDFMKEVYDIFHMSTELTLSTRPKKAMGEIELWNRAEAQLTEALNEFAGENNWKINPGDGAFYGPKIDIKVKDCLGRVHQTATVQLDFQLPIRFDLTYKTAGGEGEEQYKRPVIVHRAILGSVERSFAILLEHYKGKWPFWLSPRQAIVIPVSTNFTDYANEVKDLLWNNNFQVTVDTSARTLNKMIREAQISQYNYILVVGANEQEKKTVNIRSRANEILGEKTLEECLAMFKEFNEKYE